MCFAPIAALGYYLAPLRLPHYVLSRANQVAELGHVCPDQGVSITELVCRKVLQWNQPNTDAHQKRNQQIILSSSTPRNGSRP